MTVVPDAPSLNFPITFLFVLSNYIESSGYSLLSNYLCHFKSLCERLQFRLHKLYFLCRWQVILLCDCISFWCNCIKIVHLCFRKIKKTHAYRVIYSLILWMATRLSLKILLFTNVGFELYFNNFFHQLWVWYLPFCECSPLFCRIRCHS